MMPDKIISVEIKSPIESSEAIIQLLKDLKAEFKGEDHQIDTYFHVPYGRLKWRQGNIENNLIQYYRPDSDSLKRSEVILYPIEKPQSNLKELLNNALGVDVIVDKKRKIYFIDNVKFHVDKVRGLGEFIEIEALNIDGQVNEDKLTEQCNYYIDVFGLDRNKFVPHSYSDLIRIRFKQKND
jgi:adenylate cyclase class 2